jgi:hypothetical protein
MTVKREEASTHIKNLLIETRKRLTKEIRISKQWRERTAACRFSFVLLQFLVFCFVFKNNFILLFSFSLSLFLLPPHFVIVHISSHCPFVTIHKFNQTSQKIQFLLGVLVEIIVCCFGWFV